MNKLVDMFKKMRQYTVRQETNSYEPLRRVPRQQANLRWPKTSSSSTEERLDVSVDRALVRRHEIKYLISESTAAAIVRFIGPYAYPDKYCELQEKGAYPVVSLYLDSNDMQLCRESMEGKKARFKLRIRSYTDDLDYPRFFEIKRRDNVIIAKSRVRVMHDNMVHLLLGSQHPSVTDGLDIEVLNQFMLYKNSINAEPVVKVRYMRQAFESTVDDRVRITFDRDLCCKVTSTAEVELNSSGWQQVLINGVILEIKFTGAYPPWLSRMARHFGLRQQSLSKYTSCVQQACLLRFCAPKISE